MNAEEENVMEKKDANEDADEDADNNEEHEKGVIWTGSDDGLVHLTRDGGKTWSC